MYLDENLVTVNNMKGRALAEAYINEYSNSFLVDPSVASKEYRRYMTRSLIDRGFLYKNGVLYTYPGLRWPHRLPSAPDLSHRLSDHPVPVTVHGRCPIML